MTREEARTEIEEEFKIFLEGAALDDADILEEKMKENAELRKVVEANRMAIKALEQEPCENAINRQAVIDAIDKWVKAEHILETLPTDKVTPLFKSVHKLPSVNPQPKTGHWIIKDGKEQGYDIAGIKTWYIQIMCDKCGFIKTAIEGHTGHYKYCPNCRCHMVEPQEREDKK